MKVLVVEDDSKLASFLVRALGEEGIAADARASGEEAISLGCSGQYDVVILDWMLPDVDGVEVCRRMRAAGALPPILMLTARDGAKDKVAGLEAGADDFMVKPFDVDELVARVRALGRRAGVAPHVTVGPIEIDSVGRRASIGGQKLQLTAREFDVLLHLAGRAGDVVTRGDLMLDVWGAKADVGSNLVEVHISRLRDKLGPHAALVETIRGYRLRRA